MTQLSEHGKYLKGISQHSRLSEVLQSTHDAIETSIETISKSSWQVKEDQSGGIDQSQHLPLDRRLRTARQSPPPEKESWRYGTVRVRASQYRRNPCEGWCSCICHRPRCIRTPEKADYLLGSLFVGYSGLPTRTRQCNERNCRKQSIPSVNVVYFFPRWLLARVVHFAVAISYMKGPTVSLSMPRAIPDNAPILFFAVQGNLEGIRSLFDQGLASPYDVGISNGRTALHVSSGRPKNLV